MKDKKLQIFVSSTFTDLRAERQAAVEAILSSGHIPAGMELFSAGNDSQITVIERWIDESDVYLLILGGRYGSVDPKTGKSYIQLEYEYASSRNIPLFSVVISDKGLDDKVNALGRSAIEDLHNKELKEFRSSVLTKLVKFWDDTKDIKIAIYETLAEFSNRKGLIGWVRANNSVDTGFLAEEIAKITRENVELRNKLEGFEINANKENRFELKFVVRKNKIEKIQKIINDIKDLKGVVEVIEDEGSTGRRYLLVKISNDANRADLVGSIGNILDD